MFDIENQAVRYALLGYCVFPCIGKKPPPSFRWKDRASNIAADVRRLFEKHPKAKGIGLVVPRGALVLDCDKGNGKNGIAALKDLALNGWDPTINPQGPVAQTGGGGLHLWYRSPERLQELGNKRKGLPPGIDVRSSGAGYVVVPPSIHPDTGNAYKWLENLVPVSELPWLPDWIESKLLDSKKSQLADRPASTAPQSNKSTILPRALQKSLEAAEIAVKAAPGGSRNDTLNSKAYALFGLFADQGVNTQIINDRLSVAASKAGLGWNEINRTLASAKKGIAKPYSSVSDNSPVRIPHDVILKLRGKPALTLYTMVAYQERNGKCNCSNYKEWGLSRQQFRTAEQLLEKLDLVSFNVVKGRDTGANPTNQTVAAKRATVTNQYTVATLLNHEGIPGDKSSANQSKRVQAKVPSNHIVPIVSFLPPLPAEQLSPKRSNPRSSGGGTARCARQLNLTMSVTKNSGSSKESVGKKQLLDENLRDHLCKNR